jgi:LysW-gamma-L-lysine carboxypeptidase
VNCLTSNSLDTSTENSRIGTVEKAVSIYSPSGGEAEFANMIQNELSSSGLNPRIDRAGNVVCEIGRGEISLLLCGHMDTVPGQLPTKFEGRVVHGRGACDAKGPLLSLMFAFQDLALSSTEGRIVFAAVTGEELRSEGLNELIQSNIRTDFAIFGEPGGLAKITVGYRGHLTVRLEVITPEVHASAPKLTTNSAELTFAIYNSIKEKLDAVNSESTERVSVSLTQINSGTSHNVIPGRTTATIDVRTPVGFSGGQIIAKINEVLPQYSRSNSDSKINLDFGESTSAYRVRLNSPLVRALSRAILKSGEKPTMIMKSGTGDMNTYALAYGIDAVTYGPGDAKLSHTSEERVNVDEIFSCASVIVNAAKELIAIKSKEKRV